MDNIITVVSGLPRSGTSMLMRMLASANMEILVDGVRESNDDNPLGYYEYEKVKDLSNHTDWLSDAQGMAIKIISFYLSSLPQQYQYKIIFIKRKMEEVLKSQEVMLTNRNKHDTQYNYELEDIYQRHLTEVQNWLSKTKMMDVHYVYYHEIIQKPRELSLEIIKFLGKKMDVNEMVRGVEPALYRNKVIV